jgi:RNA polymerase sigma-70 factor (ECF subfamily)
MSSGENRVSLGLSFDCIVREHFGRIQRAALVLTGNRWDADDLAQETFLVLAAHPEKFQGRSALYTYLYGILLNLERRERRRHGVRRRKLKLLWNAEAGAEPIAAAADVRAEAAEWKRSLWAYVARLPDGQRQTLVLRFSEGLRYDEIACVLECPLGTVKSRIFHALHGLRKILSDEGHDACDCLPTHAAEDLSHAI